MYSKKGIPCTKGTIIYGAISAVLLEMWSDKILPSKYDVLFL